jgi:hypothetical protein
MSIEITSIKSFENNLTLENRLLVNLLVIFRDVEYNWSIYCPENEDIGTFVSNNEQNVYDEIAFKEIVWRDLDPKTREIDDPITGDPITVDIDKSEIVRPDVPDYYALRRAAYPSIGDQLDALWRGSESQEYADMLAKINAVKTLYPKPDYRPEE